MFCFVFDLDDTLLPTSKLITNSVENDLRNLYTTNNSELIRMYYKNLIKRDGVLNSLLGMLNGPKVILTNSSGHHASFSLQALEIHQNFVDVLNANRLHFVTKPNVNAYITTELLIKKMDPCSVWRFVFFDDIKENLVAAKRLGWITVYINKNMLFSGNGSLLSDIRPYFSGGGVQQHSETSFIDFQFSDIYNALDYFIKRQR